MQKSASSDCWRRGDGTKVNSGSRKGDAAVAAVASTHQTPTGVRKDAPAAGTPWPSPARGWYAVFVLALGLLVSFLDRGILSLLVEPIKHDLGVNDTQMSLLMGFAFVCFYLVVALPIARLADYKSRHVILGVGVAIYSLATGMCGLARSFGQLFLGRIGMGIGEACLGPPAFSLLADFFPPEKLPRAFAVLFFGAFAGDGLSLIAGGALGNWFLHMHPRVLPLVGVLHGWQLTLLALGFPGLLIAALMATVLEPERRGRLGSGAMGAISFRQVLRFLHSNTATYLPLFAGLAVSAALSFGVRSWSPAFYIRTYLWTISRYGLVQGIITLTVLPVGAFVGGVLAEWFAKRGYHDANVRVVLLGSLLMLPGSILFPLMPTATLAIGISVFGLFFAFWTNAPMNAALQVITPNEMRGQITALFLFVFNVVGFGFGPTIIALFTDFVLRSEKLLGHSIALAAFVLGSLATFVIWLGLQPYGRAAERMQSLAD